ncbi:MAG: hypothetical protein WC453_04305 [Patescibacteria group bacterium]
METQPSHWLDTIFWPLLRFFWEPFSVKHSHWWHWLSYQEPLPDNEDCLIIAANPAARRANKFWPNFYERNFGWQQVALLNVYDDTGQPARNYRAGYSCGAKKEICSILLSRGVGVLIGPEDTLFFAVSQDGRPLRVRLHSYSDRKKLKNTDMRNRYPLI